jgi:hypothetical protein
VIYTEDGTQWYNYFHIRKYNEGVFYIAWNGTVINAWPFQDFDDYHEAKRWIVNNTIEWRQKIDEKFEKEVLDAT